MVVADEVRLGRPPKYPWEGWTDGKTWKVTRGVDFQIVAVNFQNMLHVKARSIGKKVATRVDGDEVTFEFYTSEDVVEAEVSTE